jgi:hypothetical protein
MVKYFPISAKSFRQGGIKESQDDITRPGDKSFHCIIDHFGINSSQTMLS